MEHSAQICRVYKVSFRIGDFLPQDHWRLRHIFAYLSLSSKSLLLFSKNGQESLLEKACNLTSANSCAWDRWKVKEVPYVISTVVNIYLWMLCFRKRQNRVDIMFNIWKTQPHGIYRFLLYFGVKHDTEGKTFCVSFFDHQQAFLAALQCNEMMQPIHKKKQLQYHIRSISVAIKRRLF